VGGIVRDILSKGARPIACLNPLRLGDIKNNERSKYLFENIVKGIGGYGNTIGVPTVGGEAEFDKSFDKNPLVNVVCIGLVEKDKIIHGIASAPGDTLLLVGSKTGRDGIHGVTFASEELSASKEEEDRPAVQIEDPLSEKLLIDSCLEAYATGYIRGCKDLGGGGFTCATSEIVFKGDRGACIDLDKLPLREKGMQPWEVLLSETQERMILVVEKGKEEIVEKIFDKYDVLSVRVGEVTEEKKFQIVHKGKVIVDVPPSLLGDGPLFDRKWEEPKRTKIEKIRIDDPKEHFLKLLKEPNIASKKWLYEQYDYHVQTRTAIKPGSDAAVLQITKDEGMAVAADCNSHHAKLDPREGAKGAVAESIRNITAVGAKPLAFVDCLNFGNPEKPEAFWEFKEAVEGMAEAMKAFDTPVVSGNVSFYNEADGQPIDPSPVVTCVGKLRLKDMMTMGLKEGEIVMIGETRAELGTAPKVDLENEKKTNDLVHELIQKKAITACHDISRGGLAVALTKMAFEGGMGFEVDLESMKEKIDPNEKLFSESHGRFLVVTDKASEVLETAKRYGIIAQKIGKANGSALSFGVFSVSLNDAKKMWETALESYLI